MLIAQNFRGGYSVVSQSEAVSELVKRGLSKSEVYGNGWLDIEDIYRKSGWKVVYDKPGYNESYEPTFTFSRKRD